MKKKWGPSKKKTEWKWSPGKPRKKKKPFKMAFNPPIELSPEGHVFTLDWSAVPGAKKAIVDHGELRFLAKVYNRSVGTVDHKSSQSNKAIDLDLKSDQALRYLRFTELQSGQNAIANQTHLNNAGLRLVCSAKLNGAWVPLYAIPKLGKRGGVPAMLGGASFNGGLLKIPGSVVARHWRIELTTGNKIEDFSAQAIQLESASATIRQSPVDPKVLGPDGAELWSQKGPWQGLDGSVSLRIPAEQALQSALNKGEAPLHIEYRIASADHGQVLLASNRINGALIREHSGIWDHQLRGEVVPMTFDPALANESPQSAQADLTLNYDGIRMLTHANTQVSASGPGKVLGQILANKPFQITLPKKIFSQDQKTLPPARVGLLGRAVGTCELVAKFIDKTNQRVIGEPAVLNIESDSSFKFHWFVFPEKPFEAAAPFLEIIATRGRFYWVDGQPSSLKMAVYDPDPGNRPILLNGQVLARVSETKIHLPSQSLATSPFQGAHPQLMSDLFLKAEFSDLQLRYAR